MRPAHDETGAGYLPRTREAYACRAAASRRVVFEPGDRIIEIFAHLDVPLPTPEPWAFRGRRRADNLGDLTIAVGEDDILTFSGLPDQLGELPCGFGNGDAVRASILAHGGGQFARRGERDP